MGDNQSQTSGEPDTTSRTGRQRNCCKGKQMESRTPPARLGDRWLAIRENEWIGDIQSQTPPARLGDKWIVSKRGTNELETAEEPDTTSQTRRQMNCYKGRQMNWRHPKSRTPPARLGDKWIAVRGNKSIGDIQRAGHHKPDWETNELL